jgi:hypothetical protein
MALCAHSPKCLYVQHLHVYTIDRRVVICVIPRHILKKHWLLIWHYRETE